MARAGADPTGPNRTVAAAIISGGRGRRMAGTASSIDKGALLVGGRSILDRQRDVLAPLFSRVLLISNTARQAAHPGLTVIKDRGPPGLGPLAGLDAALAALLPEEEAVVCVGGDMPLLAPALIELLRDTDPQASAVVPRVQGQAQPLLARYARVCAPAIAAALAARALKTTDVLAAIAVHWLDEASLRAVDAQLSSFENANTPQDLQRIVALAASAARVQ
jgi:molybdopterin-guanine dinucleotide biosynthesis protein A